MAPGIARTLGVLVVGAAYWWFVARITGAAEPWDARAYWQLWYPASFAISAALGLILKEHGWIAGAIVTLAQAPVMLLNNGAGPLLGLAVLMLCVLALPVTAVSALAAWFASRPRAQ